jgi:hypothetical protein
MGDLREIKKRAGALLDGLGRDPDEVADSLRQVGVQGVPRSNSSCAIAVFTRVLLQADPRIRSVAVGPCTLVLTLAAADGSRPGGPRSSAARSRAPWRRPSSPPRRRSRSPRLSHFASPHRTTILENSRNVLDGAGVVIGDG